MNKICKTCDTRNRLNLCNGRNGDFKYCYRPCGSISNITDISIQPFNDVSEVETNFDGYIINDEKWIEEYGGEHFKIMMAKINNKYAENGKVWKQIETVPIGFIIC